MADNKYSYHRPGEKRKIRLLYVRLAAVALAVLLLAGGIWGITAIVRHHRDVKAQEQAARLQAEEQARLEEAQALLVAQEQAQMQSELSAYEQTFAANVYLDGELITGRTYEDVLTDFTQRYDLQLNRTVTVSFNGAQWTLTPADMGGTADVQARVDEAWAYVHTGTDEEKHAQLAQLLLEPVYITVSVTFDDTAVTDFARQLKTEVDADPVDASMEIVGAGETETTDSQLGYVLDAEATALLLSAALSDESILTVELVPEVLWPEVTEDELGGDYVRLAEYATFFKGSTDNRAYNIKLALDNFNEMVVQPGQTVSFNAVVGPRTAGRGYREAVEYQDGQSVTGVGGGVCQASTTLYGAVLRAGLEINQRAAHSLPVKYVPPSQDATVSNQGTDLVFTNNTSGPIYIYTSVNRNKNRAVVSIYGTPLKSYVEIEIESEIIQGDIAATPRYIKDTEGTHVWYADEVPVLKKAGTLGYKSCAYRIHRHKDSGEILKKELLSTDYYAPTPAEYYIGVH